MARVTVEDCILQIPNRFDLVLLAAQRAKQISSGNPLTIDRDNDKDAVVSLREIADQTISLDQLDETLIQSFFKRPVSDIADKKLLTADEDETEEKATASDATDAVDEDVKEAFKDAASQGDVDQTPATEAPEGMSYNDENIDPDD